MYSNWSCVATPTEIPCQRFINYFIKASSCWSQFWGSNILAICEASFN